MGASDDAEGVDRALAEERALVASLGGYSLEIAGASLVTHERIPVPRFNFVQDVRVAAARQSAFFERALDHYFQRSIRPTIRIGEPVPPHLDRGVSLLGFRRAPEPHLVLLARSDRPGRWAPGVEVREPRADEFDTVAGFWMEAKDRAELRRSLEVIWTHPNPDERLTPLLAFRGDRPVGAALVHAYSGVYAIHAVATRPDARGQGVASSIVDAARREIVPSGRPVAIHADARRLVGRLGLLGFAVAREFRVYELPEDAELSLPRPGPAGPPRWRPPRAAPG
ncbi:MAG TPA: GNAT family N-acetyltransferase [Thermoplasmata archaeon]|nr:GNAT family N-acetyltransferase [Thermoplasmata archaeon]